MRRAAGIAIGVGGGASVGAIGLVGVWRGIVPITQDTLFLVGTPGAHVVSWITGWPLRQEAALACYASGFAVTIVLVTAVVGGALGALGSR